MDWITVIVNPFFEWLYDTATVVVTVVPNFGGLPLVMVASGFSLLLIAWHYDFL